MFINLSNHPSGDWSEEQRAAARALVGGAGVVDVPFPPVPPEASERGIDILARRTLDAVPVGAQCAMVMGEFTMTLALVGALQRRGVKCVAATTRREVVWRGHEKVSAFRFVRLREYVLLVERR